METSNVISTDKATVVIQVNPQVTQNAVTCADGQEARGAYHNTTLAEFFKAQPKALGTVQIMIGVVIFLFGIIRTIDNHDISVYNGITFWGSIVYITAGSLSVAAQNKLHLCVVKASLIMNVISAMTAGIAIILLSMVITFSSEFHKRCYSDYSRDYNSGYGRDYTKKICSDYETLDLGISGILLVFSILQFIISIYISGFACKATCSSSTVVNVALNQGN